jgi:hypothetical protein
MGYVANLVIPNEENVGLAARQTLRLLALLGMKKSSFASEGMMLQTLHCDTLERARLDILHSVIAY